MDKRYEVKVLLVEDEPAHLDLAQIAIDEANKINGKKLVVMVARNGVEALEKLRGGYRPDLILLDLKLPRLSGQDLLRIIKGDDGLRTIPVIILTTSKLDEDIKSAYNDNATAYLVKPLRLDPLIDTMDRMKKWFTNPQMRLSER